jgi:hypothetical protein
LFNDLNALTLEQLRQDPGLTPQRFASYFSHFRFERRDALQKPDDFLANRAGDCDDYATLANLVLREKGYHTKLLVVRMTEEIHVVCYVAEAGCYLDYNNRAYLVRTVKTNGSLEDIAGKVAQSFRSRWVSVGDYTAGGAGAPLGRVVFARRHGIGSEVQVVRSARSNRPAPVQAVALPTPGPIRVTPEDGIQLAASVVAHN